jgi:hypothetical protein
MGSRATAALLGQVELAVSDSSKKGIPLVRPEDQNWSLTIFRVPNPHDASEGSDFHAPAGNTFGAFVPYRI